MGEKLETHKAFLVGHMINQGRKIYSGRHACLTKENVTEMLRASRRHSSLFMKYCAYFGVILMLTK